jgi:hypothetical protein
MAGVRGRRLFVTYLWGGGDRGPEPFGPELTAEGLVEGNAEGAELPRR